MEIINYIKNQNTLEEKKEVRENTKQDKNKKKEKLKILNTSKDMLEKYVREELFMKKKNAQMNRWYSLFINVVK